MNASKIRCITERSRRVQNTANASRAAKLKKQTASKFAWRLTHGLCRSTDQTDLNAIMYFLRYRPLIQLRLLISNVPCFLTGTTRRSTNSELVSSVLAASQLSNSQKAVAAARTGSATKTTLCICFNIWQFGFEGINSGGVP